MEGSLLLFLCVFCFILGFLSVALFVSWRQAVHVRKDWTLRNPHWSHIGCKKVLELAKQQHPHAPTYNNALTGVMSIDKELEDVLGYGVRDYFEKWYHLYISPDPVCVQHAREVVDHVIKEVSIKAKQVDYLSYFVETIMDDFMEHLRLYKGARQAVELTSSDDTTSRDKLIERAFFEAESKDDPWRAVCCSTRDRQAYLQRLTELLLCLLLPKEEFINTPLQVLLTDIIVWQVWTPLLRTLTQPDYFNSTIITMCKDSALNPETFMTSITEGATNSELERLLTKLRIHIAHVQKTGITDLHQQKLSALESVMETAQQVINGDRTVRSNHNSSLLSFGVTIPKYSIEHEGGTKHCIFHVHVKCQHSKASVEEQWVTYRRYRDFHDLHLTLRNQLGNFPSTLSLPTLPSFNKLDPQRLEVRRQGLAGYLKVVASEKFLREHTHALGHVVLFLTEGEYTRSSNELTRMVDSFVQPLRRTATLAIKTTASSARSSISSSSSGASPNSTPKPSPSQLRKQPSTTETKLPPPEEEEDSLPINMMLELLDELFDLKDLQWLRRQLPVLLKQLAGERISRKIVRTTDWLTSADQASEYIHKLGSTLWPDGYPATPHPPPSRDVIALRTLLARAKLIGSIPDDLRRIIGTETTIRGMTRLFNMMQSETLNCRLALLLLEGLLDTMFPSRNLKDAFKKLRREINEKH